MKILWFTNKEFIPEDDGHSGTWLQPLAEKISKSGDFELANICYGKTDRLVKRNCGNIQQWIIPYTKPNKKGLPAKRVVEEILNIHNQFSPDIVHFWGVEYFWGLLTARNYIKTPALLDIQGLIHEIARNYAGGLSVLDQIKCIGLREIILRSNFFQDRQNLFRWGIYEKEMIKNNKNIITQSPWIEAKVKSINPTGEIFHNELALRPQFYNAAQWKPKKSTQNIRIFCSASYPAPFKGVHIAIRAVARLKKEYPNIQLRLAGLQQGKSIRKHGYISWLEAEIKKQDFEKNIAWLGYLNADEIITELQLCSAAIIPSFTESYCVALAEGMILGVPTVTSFTGGTSYLARDDESALFFPIGDVEMCAYQIKKVLCDAELANKISQNSRELGLVRNDLQKIVDQEIRIYTKVFQEK